MPSDGLSQPIQRAIHSKNNESISDDKHYIITSGTSVQPTLKGNGAVFLIAPQTFSGIL